MIAGRSRPADQTGGDVFDVILEGGSRLVLLLGDATGHGIGPALSVTQVRSMLRMAMRLGAGLDSVFTHLNDQLSEDLATNRFVTAFLGVLDPERHAVAYHSAGQGPILLAEASGTGARILKPTAPPLGLLAGLPPPTVRPVEMGPGDVLALITDGIFEYENDGSEPFGHERVQRLLAEHRADSAEALLQRIVDAVGAFAGTAPQGDDMTIVIVRRLPA